MKKVLVLVVVLVLALLISCQAIAGFQESRWQIIENLADPEKDYPVSKSGWERTDLRDGTPRWMNDVRGKHVYELIGSPINKVTLLGEIGPTERSGAELGRRIMDLMLAVGIEKDKLSEVSVELFNATVPDPGVKYYIVSGKIRVELIYYDSLGAFMLILTKS